MLILGHFIDKGLGSTSYVKVYLPNKWPIQLLLAVIYGCALELSSSVEMAPISAVSPRGVEVAWQFMCQILLIASSGSA